jgi:hypothetical protein
MANTFPPLSSGSMVVHGTLGNNSMMQHPANLVNSFVTRTVQFLNSSEQRWTVRTNLFGAVLEFRGLCGYDLSLLRNFFVSLKGSYVDDALLNTFSMTIAGIIYNFLHFDDDKFEAEADNAERYSVKLKVSQVRPN